MSLYMKFFVLISQASTEGSDKPGHNHSLVRPVPTQTVGKYRSGIIFGVLRG